MINVMTEKLSQLPPTVCEAQPQSAANENEIYSKRFIPGLALADGVGIYSWFLFPACPEMGESCKTTKLELSGKDFPKDWTFGRTFRLIHCGWNNRISL